MDTVKLSKEEIVKLAGLKKAKVMFPEMFKETEQMHPITDDDVYMLVTVARGEMSPAKKYEDRCLALSGNYHWSLIKRQVNGSFTTFLVPIDKKTSKQNPLRKQMTAIAGPNQFQKVAAKKKRKTRKTKTDE